MRRWLAFLLADMEAQGQQALLMSGAECSSDILKYPHHGLAAMNETLLRAISPSAAIITAQPGKANEALAQLDALGIQAVYTGESMIRLRTDGRIWVMDAPR